MNPRLWKRESQVQAQAPGPGLTRQVLGPKQQPYANPGESPEMRRAEAA